MVRHNLQRVEDLCAGLDGLVNFHHQSLDERGTYLRKREPPSLEASVGINKVRTRSPVLAAPHEAIHANRIKEHFKICGEMITFPYGCPYGNVIKC